MDFDREKGAKGRHLGRQNRAKIDPKAIQNRVDVEERTKRRSKNVLYLKKIKKQD